MDSDAGRELREIFLSRMNERFMDARICLMRARVAHQGGDHAELGKWMECVRTLRKAAARWRRRARNLAPMLVCLVGFLHGCSVGHSLMIDDNTPVPKQLIEPLCVKAAGGRFSDFHWDGNHPTHWDGGALWELDTGGYVIGVECTVTAFESGWPETLTVRGSIHDPVAKPLLTLLQERR